MTNKELVYEYGKNYRNDILVDLVNRADEILSNKIFKQMIERCVDLMQIEVEQRRYNILSGSSYSFVNDSESYRTVLTYLLVRDKHDKD